MHLDEYVDLFGLSAEDLNSRVLEYGRVSCTTPVSWNDFGQPVICYASDANAALPFPDFAFDLVLCPDYLFTDEDNQNIDFHLQQIAELARVAKEVRIFPLSNSHGLPSPLLGPVLLGLQQENYGVEVRDVTTALHPKGNAMLRVWAQQCHVS